MKTCLDGINVQTGNTGVAEFVANVATMLPLNSKSANKSRKSMSVYIVIFFSFLFSLCKLSLYVTQVRGTLLRLLSVPLITTTDRQAVCFLSWLLPRPGAEVCAKTVAKPKASSATGRKSRKSIIPPPIDHRQSLNPKASTLGLVCFRFQP